MHPQIDVILIFSGLILIVSPNKLRYNYIAIWKKHKRVKELYFAYGDTELSYLRQKDKRLCEVIDRIGHINRAVDVDLFSSVIHHIIGQQISTKAQATIWQRMQDALGAVNAETILTAGVPKLQGLGMTFRKAEYITDFAEKVHTGAFGLNAVERMNDEDADPGIKQPERNRCLDGRNDPAFLYAAPGHFKLP